MNVLAVEKTAVVVAAAVAVALLFVAMLKNPSLYHIAAGVAEFDDCSQ